MSNLSNTRGEGGGGGRAPGSFTDTGYGTHDGQGNVRTGAESQKGTGYDEHGQVSTSFGKWPVSYDPVTGMATEHVTAGYDMGGADMGGGAGGGLVDVSAGAPGHGAVATPEMQQALQDFFERQSAEGAAAAAGRPQAGQAEGQRVETAGAEEGQGAGGAQAREDTGQGVAERMDARAFLPDQPELTGEQAESWRSRR